MMMNSELNRGHVRDEHPLLTTLLGGYLHQDYDDEHGSANGAIDAFAAETTRVDREALALEIASLFARYDDATLPRAIEMMGNAYDYEREGRSAHEWLRSVVARVNEHEAL